MKSSIVSGIMIATFAWGCGSSDDAPAATSPKKRTMVTGSLVVGTVVNLVPDPGFALAADSSSYGGFYGYTGADSKVLDIVPVRDSRSPAGLRGSVAVVTSPGATDTTGTGISLISAVTGGTGPFHAEVWLSKSTLAGTPTSFEPNEITVAMLDQQNGAVNLNAVDTDIQLEGDRKWVPMRADFADGFATGGYLSLTIPTSGGTWHIAAPSLVAQPLVDGVPTRALRWPTVRAQTPPEKSAIVKAPAPRRI